MSKLNINSPVEAIPASIETETDAVSQQTVETELSATDIESDKMTEKSEETTGESFEKIDVESDPPVTQDPAPVEEQP